MGLLIVITVIAVVVLFVAYNIEEAPIQTSKEKQTTTSSSTDSSDVVTTLVALDLMDGSFDGDGGFGGFD